MLLYEGKAKQIYSTENKNEFIVYFKDDATAFNGEKKAQISSKGILNNKISTILFEMLHKEQIKTHFVKNISEREMLVKKVEILPLEVIVRNITALFYISNELLSILENAGNIGIPLPKFLIEACEKINNKGM